MLVCVFFHNFAHETAGAARIRHSPRPLISRRETTGITRANGAARWRSHVRHRYFEEHLRRSNPFFLCVALWIASLRLAMTARLRRLLAGRIEPGIDAALEARERFQAFFVRERQQLHQDHAADVTRRVDPEIGV